MGKHRLSKKLHDAITRLCEEGDELVKKGDERAAYDKYNEAWNLVPEDKQNWEASTWILSAAGEIHFQLRQFDKALNCFLRAVQCPGGLGNPYIHLRIGQSQFELGNMNRAGDELTRAYMGAGKEIFDKEDPKYFDYLNSILKPPANPSS